MKIVAIKNYQDLNNGIMTFANGDKYNGEWKNDIIEGKGVFIWANGDIYEGRWKNCNRYGNGKMIYANGDIYEGEWYDKQKIGRFIITYKYGTIYEGNIGNCIDSVITTRDKKVIKCATINGLTNGYGSINFPDGTKYEGDIYDNLQHGYGMLTNLDGYLVTSMWKCGKVSNEELNLPECNICMEHKVPLEFSSYCNHCNKRLCNNCYNKNYNNDNSKNIILKNSFCCPFCKQVPFYITMSEEIKSIFDKSDKFYKCIECNKYEAVIESCGNNNDIEKILCNKCFMLKNDIKQCRKCRVYIEKNGGCNHIKCRCGFEFCWNCYGDWKYVDDDYEHYKNKCIKDRFKNQWR
jgi:hypothetical protein